MKCGYHDWKWHPILDENQANMGTGRWICKKCGVVKKDNQSLNGKGTENGMGWD